MYLVNQRFYKHNDYPYNGGRFINTFNFLYDAIQMCEVILETAYFSKNGTNEPIKYFTIQNDSELRSVSNGIRSNNYFIVKSPNIYLQYTIYQKQKKSGLIYNGFEIVKVFSLDIMKAKKDYYKIKPVINEIYDYDLQYNEVMNELLEKTKSGDFYKNAKEDLILSQ